MKRKRNKEEILEKRKKLFKKFTPEQKDRYSHFTQSKIDSRTLKQKILKQTNIGSKSLIVLSGISKLFVGDMVEYSKKVMTDWGVDPTTPIKPEHLREAFRRYQKDGKLFDKPKEKVKQMVV